LSERLADHGVVAKAQASGVPLAIGAHGLPAALQYGTRLPALTAMPTNSPKTPARAPKLLSGGNPQIPKADGDAPVQAYIAAMPGWKREVGRQLDALIERTVPGVRKAVRWNSPFYGVEGQGWFLSYHCFTKYIKLTFFRGTSLEPVPPGASKSPEVRYLDIHESGVADETQLTSWIKQAAALPGWDGGSASSGGIAM
jgi:hypothetical protein